MNNPCSLLVVYGANTILYYIKHINEHSNRKKHVFNISSYYTTLKTPCSLLVIYEAKMMSYYIEVPCLLLEFDCLRIFIESTTLSLKNLCLE